MHLPQKLIEIAYMEEINSCIFYSVLARSYQNAVAEIGEMLQLFYFFLIRFRHGIEDFIYNFYRII